MKSLTKINPGSGNPDYRLKNFWKKYDAGEFGKPIYHAQFDPAFQQWMKDVAAMPAEKQVEAVAKKLQEINPGFDGKVTGIASWEANSRPKIEGGVVTEIGFLVEHVTDLSPVRALAGLKKLSCVGNNGTNEGLSDLSPLKGMRLVMLTCRATHVSDLSPLRGMPLTARRLRLLAGS